MSGAYTADLERKGNGTGVFLPRVSVSRRVKWAAAGSESAANSLYGPVFGGAGNQALHAVIENAPSAAPSHVLPNLTPVSSPTANAVHNISSSMSGSQVQSGLVQLSRGAGSEEYSSSSWSEHLAAPEVGGWSIKRASNAASNSSSSSSICSQPPRSGARMMQQLQLEQVQPTWIAQPPPPPRQDERSPTGNSGSTLRPAAGTPVPAPPPPRSRTPADSTSAAAAGAIAQVPASCSYQLHQGYSHLNMPGAFADACGNLYIEGPSIAHGSSRRAARAAALATMITGSTAQPKFWEFREVPVDNTRSSGGTIGDVTIRLQQQQQQAEQHRHTAALPGAALSRGQQSQQLQLMQQPTPADAAAAAGAAIRASAAADLFYGNDVPLQQAACSDLQPDMLLGELDVQMLQLLQLRKQLESGAASAAAVATSRALPSPDPSYSAATLPGSCMVADSASEFEAYHHAAGMACMQPAPAMQLPGMPAGKEAAAPLQLPGLAGWDLPQLLMAASADDSSRLASLGADDMLQPLQHSDPCLALYRDAMPSGSHADPYVGSGSVLDGQGVVRQARVSEVKQRMQQLSDIQSVQRQLQEELLALLQ